ncbi:MAG: hypothetical protein ACOC58_00295 [Chloroflexota bacterium]
MRQLDGHPAEDLARVCFSKLRFYRASLKTRLRREGLWEDLAQELYRIALEGWHQGMTAREIGGMATREIRAFLRAYGYQRYRLNHQEGYAKLDVPLSAICESHLCKASSLPNADTRGDLEREILSLLRKHPEGLSQCLVNRALKRLAPAPTVTFHCERLVVRGAIKAVPRPKKGIGGPPSPLLVAFEAPACELAAAAG